MIVLIRASIFALRGTGSIILGHAAGFARPAARAGSAGEPPAQSAGGLHPINPMTAAVVMTLDFRIRIPNLLC
jgi:hypothetical protein